MADLHIDDFYRDVATVLLRLYAVFPRKVTLYVEDIAGPDEPDEFGLHHPRFQAAFSAAIWLADQGYIYFADTIRQEALDQVTLTRQTFLLLASAACEPLTKPPADDTPPSLIAESMRSINQLRHALRQGLGPQIRQVVSELLSRPSIGT
ncbi:MAG: hypothetical protein ACK5ME_06255 [Parahaliea sp.]